MGEEAAVNEEVYADVMARLDAIAAKLGVAAEHLWGAVVRQQVIEGVALLCCAALVAGFWVWGLYLIGKLASDEGPKAFGALLSSFVLGGIFCSLLYGALPMVLNPEYAAFKDVVRMLR